MTNNEQHQQEKQIKTLNQLKVDYISPKDLFRNDYNPNRQSKKEFELLKKSITEDGFTQPIIANRIEETSKGELLMENIAGVLLRNWD